MEKSTLFNPDEFETMHLIGTGNFSDLYLVEHSEEKKPYCMKIFDKAKVKRMHKEEDVLIERHVREKLPKHEYIVDYHGCHKDDLNLCILYEYINGGELWRVCSVFGMPYESYIKTYFLQTIMAIKHMHDNRILHRDIKVPK